MTVDSIGRYVIFDLLLSFLLPTFQLMPIFLCWFYNCNNLISTCKPMKFNLSYLWCSSKQQDALLPLPPRPLPLGGSAWPKQGSLNVEEGDTEEVRATKPSSQDSVCASQPSVCGQGGENSLSPSPPLPLSSASETKGGASDGFSLDPAGLYESLWRTSWLGSLSATDVMPSIKGSCLCFACIKTFMSIFQSKF